MKKNDVRLFGFVLLLGWFSPISLAEEWSKKTGMPTPRLWCSTCTLNGKIYAIGGSAEGPPLSTIEEFNPVSNEWTQKPNMQMAKASMAACVVDEKIYVIG